MEAADSPSEVRIRTSLDPADILWYAYREHAGLDALDVCRKLGVVVSRSAHLKRWQALYMQPYAENPSMVILPPFDPSDTSAREGFLAFHELAHHFFFQRLVVRGIKPNVRWHDERRRQEEIWCDNFAVAMLFAFFGVRVMDGSSRSEFFHQREETLRPEDDISCGRLIRRLCVEHRHVLLARRPLRRIAHHLVLHPEDPDSPA